MSNLLFANGHIAWPLFIAVTFSMIFLLVTDIAWRILEMRFAVLLAVALTAWVVGTAGIIIAITRLGAS